MQGFALRDQTKAPAPSKNAVLSSTPLEGNSLFEALICEFHWVALQIGGITAILNASLEGRRAWVIRSCRNLVPVEAAIVDVALRSWQDMAIPKDKASRIRSVFLCLNDAKRHLEPLMDAAGAYDTSPASIAKLEQLTIEWRNLAKNALDAVQCLEPETRWRMNALFSQNALVLAKFLKDCVLGRHDCVDVRGDVSLPVLPQRRRAPRHALLQHCRVSMRGLSVPAFAHDVSQSGFGITCKHPFKLKDIVNIELQNGRRFTAMIVWAKDGRLGLHLESPLANNDLLISSG
jgi:hypothetical protein